jgi:hypothetical protein
MDPIAAVVTMRPMRIRAPSTRWLFEIAAALAASVLLAFPAYAENAIATSDAISLIEAEDDGEAEDGEAEPDEADVSGAEIEALPLLEIGGSVALGYETIILDDASSSRVREAFANVEAEVTVHLAPNARLGAVLAFEPVTDPAPGEDRFFADHGLFAEELYAGLDIGRAALQLGKIAPTFGWAADDAPGLYGGEIPGEYEIVEQLGAKARVSLSEAAGFAPETTIEHALHVALFAADTTFLSDSLLTSRGDLDVSDGGVGNTGFPESVAVAYTVQVRDAEDELAGPSFQAALRRLAPGAGDDHAEWGLLAAFEDRRALGRGFQLSPIAEAAYFVHAEGEADPAWALTLGAELAKGSWLISSTWGTRHVLTEGSEPDYAITADLGRLFEVPGLGELRADIAYAFARDEEGRKHVIGVEIERELDFRLLR